MFTELFIFYIGNFIGFILTLFLLFIGCFNRDIFTDEILGDKPIKNIKPNRCLIIKELVYA